jgi:hypothetical protein
MSPITIFFSFYFSIFLSLIYLHRTIPLVLGSERLPSLLSLSTVKSTRHAGDGAAVAMGARGL